MIHFLADFGCTLILIGKHKIVISSFIKKNAFWNKLQSRNTSFKKSPLFRYKCPSRVTNLIPRPYSLCGLILSKDRLRKIKMYQVQKIFQSLKKNIYLMLLLQTRPVCSSIRPCCQKKKKQYKTEHLEEFSPRPAQADGLNSTVGLEAPDVSLQSVAAALYLGVNISLQSFFFREHFTPFTAKFESVLMHMQTNWTLIYTHTHINTHTYISGFLFFPFSETRKSAHVSIIRYSNQTDCYLNYYFLLPVIFMWMCL